MVVGVKTASGPLLLCWSSSAQAAGQKWPQWLESYFSSGLVENRKASCAVFEGSGYAF